MASIAYLILAHKNLAQVVRLIDRLAGEQARFVLHVDARTDIADHRAELRARPRVLLLDESRATPWGSFELVRATLDVMAAALDADGDVRRLTLLSGQDYPIKPRDRIEGFLLGERRDTSFIEHFPLPRREWGTRGGMERIEDWHVELGGRRRSLRNSRVGIRRSLPGRLKPYQGGQYWSMTRSCAEHVLRSVDERPSLARFFRHAGVPDELFFQTIVMNSQLAAKVVNSDLRYERWDEGKDHPAVLTTADLPALRASPALFAKKFDTSVDERVLDRVDSELLGRRSRD
jgi:hypothetical protein